MSCQRACSPVLSVELIWLQTLRGMQPFIGYAGRPPVLRAGSFTSAAAQSCIQQGSVFKMLGAFMRPSGREKAGCQLTVPWLSPVPVGSVPSLEMGSLAKPPTIFTFVLKLPPPRTNLSFMTLVYCRIGWSSLRNSGAFFSGSSPGRRVNMKIETPRKTTRTFARWFRMKYEKWFSKKRVIAPFSSESSPWEPFSNSACSACSTCSGEVLARHLLHLSMTPQRKGLSLNRV
mmetsp:Transcript_10949/g.34778  ORF Transcript_10949/g.34778 Transcript_10949/m.34778 type:complete len:231 (-) Transcript_10949:1614-2306(-)